MFAHIRNITRLAIIVSLLLFTVVTTKGVFAQASSSNKFNDAIKRSKTGAEVVAQIAETPNQGIAKRLIDSIEAIGVFPCHKIDALVEYGVICPGVISRRLQDGWSVPAFYKFGGGGFGRPDSDLGLANTILLLFVSKESVDWLSKNFKFEGEKEARAGQIGPLTDEQLANFKTNFQIIAYSIQKDGLTGVILSNGFGKVIAIDQDNHINQSLYRIKGSEILAGKPVTAAGIPSEIFSFQSALQKHFNR